MGKHRPTSDLGQASAAADRQDQETDRNSELQQEKLREAKRRLHRNYLLIVALLLVLMCLLPRLYGTGSVSSAAVSTSSGASAQRSTVTRRSSGKQGIQSTLLPETEPPEPDYYIGNKSSKVFHRPDCASLPAEKNQIRFDTRAEAEEEGYSPCARCSP